MGIPAFVLLKHFYYCPVLKIQAERLDWPGQLAATLKAYVVGIICPTGCDRISVSEYLGKPAVLLLIMLLIKRQRILYKFIQRETQKVKKTALFLSPKKFFWSKITVKGDVCD